MVLTQLPTQKRAEITFLAACTILCFGLSVFRIWMTDTRVFFFLNWNLFLAFIPWVTTLVVSQHKSWRVQKRVVLPIMAMWLLFFPNSPYIFTDLIHLRFNSAMPVWFDLGLILCYAWTGAMFGFISLFEIEKLMTNIMSKRLIPLLSTLLLFVTAFGVYLGRFLRWNSWDIISHPSGIANDVIDRVIHPFAHLSTWGVTLLIGLFLNMIYWSLRLLKRHQQQSQLLAIPSK